METLFCMTDVALGFRRHVVWSSVLVRRWCDTGVILVLYWCDAANCISDIYMDLCVYQVFPQPQNINCILCEPCHVAIGLLQD